MGYAVRYVWALVVWIAVIAMSATINTANAMGTSRSNNLSSPANWCARGDGIACFYIAQNLLFSNHKASDVIGARIFYHRACVLGVTNACYEWSKLQAYPTTMYLRYWRLWERYAHNKLNR